MVGFAGEGSVASGLARKGGNAAKAAWLAQGVLGHPGLQFAAWKGTPRWESSPGVASRRGWTLTAKAALPCEGVFGSGGTSAVVGCNKSIAKLHVCTPISKMGGKLFHFIPKVMCGFEMG